MRSVNFALTDVFERARALRTATEGFSDTVARPSSQRSTFLARVLVLSLSLRATERSTVNVTVPRETPVQLTLNWNLPARSALSVETFEATVSSAANGFGAGAAGAAGAAGGCGAG